MKEKINFRNCGYLCYFDGACSPCNPGGNMGSGSIVIKVGEDESIDEYLLEQSNYYPLEDFDSNMTSNNVAEYLALLKVLEFLDDNHLYNDSIVILGDSNLVIKQMNGLWKVKPDGSGRYKQYHDECMELSRKFKHLKFHWIPREENVYADDLSKQGIFYGRK